MEIVKVPSSQGSLGKNLGCEKAPDLIIQGIEAEAVKVVKDNLEETNRNIEQAKGDFFIGGDHSITYPLFKSFAKQHKRPALLIFDAHADCVNNFHPPSHEDFNKVLIEDKILAAENLMLVGLREVDEIEQKYLDEKGIRYIYFKDIKSKQELTAGIKEFAKDKDLYISIDIDVLDPKEAPGTGYQVETGMQADFFLDILKNIKALAKRIDLVEVNLNKDKDNKTSDIAREIVRLVL